MRAPIVFMAEEDEIMLLRDNTSIANQALFKKSRA
jgi:hypothetical protein